MEVSGETKNGSIMKTKNGSTDQGRQRMEVSEGRQRKEV